MAASQLHELSAVELASLVRRKEASPTEIVEALLARIDRLDGQVEAWVTIDREGALQAAREIERSPQDLPLQGVPVGVKDIFLTGGLRTTAGFPPFDGFVPEHEAEAVSRLRRAGAIILGKTVTTQFALADPPKTGNPWDLEHTPGGSSSGSAAAVAARMTPLALGSQTKGSVLRPAAYCGAVGFKPTFGRISRRNVFPLAWSFDTIGLICRSVEDAALSLNVLAGHDPADPSSAAQPVADYLLASRAAVGRPKLGLIRDYFDAAEPAIQARVESVAKQLETAGAELIELRLPGGLDLAGAVHDTILHAETAALHTQLLDKEPAGYAPMLRQTIEAGRLIPAAAYIQAQRLRRRFRRNVNQMMSEVDAVLTPTATNVAPRRETTGDASLQAPWTQIGLPAISLPTGLNEQSLPQAVQLAGRRFEDGGLLAIARWAEDVLGPMPAPTFR